MPSKDTSMDGILHHGALLIRLSLLVFSKNQFSVVRYLGLELLNQK